MRKRHNRYQLSVESFIGDVIRKTDKPYKDLMVDLENKIEDWKNEYEKLSEINVFDLTGDEHDRKEYLSALMSHGKLLVSKSKLPKI